MVVVRLSWLDQFWREEVVDISMTELCTDENIQCLFPKFLGVEYDEETCFYEIVN